MDSRSMEKSRLGTQAEDAVQSFLIRRGCTLLARNFRAGNKGELDIVVRRKNRLIVVEVKSRREGDDYGGAVSAITPRKIMRMKRATAVYMMANKVTDTDVCFLAACVTHDRQGRVIKIDFLPI